MASDVFIDTSGFFALLVLTDDRHHAAARVVQDARRRRRAFVTTDHVIDETATLLKVRGHAHVLASFFDRLDTTRALRIEWTDADRFASLRAFYLKHADQAWSFTDCLSFLTMRRLRLRDALTKDHHFNQAGFTALLR